MHIAIVFAKEGSIGFPGKNMFLLHGKPLIGWLIEELIKSNVFSNIYISTNGDEIARYCNNYPQAHVIRRPDDLAKNDRFVDAVHHVVRGLPTIPQTITIPQVVQPIREKGIFERIIALHRPGIDSVVTVKGLESSLHWMYYLKDNATLSVPSQIGPVTQNPVISREENLVEIDNAIVSFTYSSWKTGKSITPWPYLGEHIVGVMQNYPNRNMAVDLHTPEDGEWLEYVMEFTDWKRKHSYARQ